MTHEETGTQNQGMLVTSDSVGVGWHYYSIVILTTDSRVTSPLIFISFTILLEVLLLGFLYFV
jgi:hypothetical protein